MTKENELTTFTFPDSGRKVLLRRVSPLLTFDLQKAFPPPTPPMQSVTIGEGVEEMQPNYAHPSYTDAMKAYQGDMNNRLQRLMIKLGVVINWTDEMKAEVQAVRDVFREETGAELDKEDVLVYVKYICVGSDGDLEDLAMRLMRRSHPTEVAISEAEKSFPGNV